MPTLEFLANMNISPMTVKQLQESGWDIIRIPEVMDARSRDIEVLRYAEQNNKVLITHDLDFSMLLAVGGYQKPSVINLRIENAKPDSVAQRIIDIVSTMEKELSEGAIVSVDETSIRYRTLPVKL